ncbi:Phycocyanobilin lyase subunit alpha [bacterium HR14]|nr:Phycocyanobilin lyase subunit alpha [bacterium HR14]
MSQSDDALNRAIRERRYAEALALALQPNIGEEGSRHARRLLFEQGYLFDAIAAALQECPENLQEWWTLANSEPMPPFLRDLDYHWRSFVCYCPLCRGCAGEHSLRLFRWVIATALVAHALNAAHEAPETHLQQAAKWLLRAAALQNPDDAPPENLTLSWVAEEPLINMLCQIRNQRPQWLLNPLHDLLQFYRERMWAGGSRTIATPFPMVTPSGDGVLANLSVSLTDAPFPELYPDPRLMLTTRWDEAFAEQLERAWELTKPQQPVRWSLTRYKSEAALWLLCPLSGPSVGAALGVGLRALKENSPSPDPDCALTGALPEDSTLGSVGGYDAKSLCFADYPSLRLVVPQADHPRACSQLPDWKDRLIPAATLEEAFQHAMRQSLAVKEYLEALAEQLDETPWYRAGQRLRASDLFTPLQVLVHKPPEDRKRREREGQERKYGNLSPYEAVRAAHYELPEHRETKEAIRWQEFVRRSTGRRVALIGAPGGGKTFSTRYWARQVALDALERLQRGEPITNLTVPLWITARKLAEASSPQQSLENALSTLCCAPSETHEWLQQALKEGRCMIVVDALDELQPQHEPAFRQIASQLEQMRGTVVVTCRALHWGERREWLGWRTLPEAAELAPLNRRAQRMLMERFFGKQSPAARQLTQLLRSSYALYHACRIPLMLTFVCLLQSENALPEDATYAELYALVLRKLLSGEWRGVNNPMSHVRREWVAASLERIGWNLFKNNPQGNLFTLHQWVSALEQGAPAAGMSPEALLESMEQVGLVVFAGYDRRGDGQWSFAHRTLLEFLAARHLSRQPNWLDEIRQHFWFQPEWWEVLTFLAGLVDDATPLVEALEQEEDDIFGSMLFLQARVVGFGRVQNETVRQRVAEKVVHHYLSNIPREFILPALRAAGKLSVPLLIQRLQDEDVKVRITACTALGTIGDSSIVPYLVRQLQDEHARVREAACWALEVIGDPSAVPHLIPLLQDEDGGVRLAACGTLCVIRGLFDTPDSLIMLNNLDWVFRALGETTEGDISGLPYLVPRLHDEDPETRRDACWALSVVGDPAAVPHLIPLLQDKNIGVRRAACEALGAIGGSSIVPYLISLLQDRDVLTAACDALGRIQDSSAVPHLIPLLQDESVSVRWIACQALGQIRDPAAVPHLIPLLQDESVSVRWIACQALSQIRDPDAVPHLIPVLQDAHALVRAAACETLGAIGDSAAVPHIIPLLLDRDILRFTALNEALGDEFSSDLIISKIISSGERVCEEACYALGSIGDPAAVPHLISCLQDEDDGVRRAACKALGAIGDPAAVPHLISCLQDEDGRVREAACEALGAIGDPAAVPHLISCLQDEDDGVRRAACEALGAIGDPAAVPHLIPRLQDEDWQLCKAACKALWRISWENRLAIRNSQVFS